MSGGIGSGSGSVGATGSGRVSGSGSGNISGCKSGRGRVVVVVG